MCDIMVPVLIGIVLLMRKGKIMAISYNGLWKLLIDNNMNKGDLCKKTGLSSSTMANDSPALSAADVGIAISDGAQIAREVADITIEADNLFELVALRKISTNLMGRIHKNYVRIVGINSGLIILGVSGVVQPTTSALLHNTSTIAISMKGMSGWKTGVTIRDGKENGHA